MGGKDLRSSCSSASKHREWQRIFGFLMESLQSQETQIKALISDRKLLEDYVKFQENSWISKTCLLKTEISQMKKYVEMTRRFETAKLDLLLSLKEREASSYKERCECAENDLDGLREFIESLGPQISEPKEKLNDKNSKEVGKGKRIECNSTAKENSTREDGNGLQKGEIKKWKLAYKQLKSKKEMEVSALLAEKDFVWNQFKKMESDYTSLLKGKRIEVEQANETIEKLQQNIENLQSSVTEKDQMIVRLKSDIVKLEKELKRWTKEVEQANGKAEKLRLDMEDLSTSANCKDETITKLKKGLAKIEMDIRRHGNVKSIFSNESSSLRSSRTTAANQPRLDLQKHTMEKRSRFDGSYSDIINGRRNCAKRKGMETEFESPSLFSATFKVPKLKNFSATLV